MDFRQLESFVSIAKYKSFSKAARELYLTQPTLSNHIQILEKELGTSLLNRSNRVITLTAAGEIFLNYSLDILNMKQQAEFNLGKYLGKIEGTIDIFSSTIPEQYIIPSLISQYSSIFPYIKYNIHHFDSFDIVENIRQNKIDYGFTGIFIKDPCLEYIPIMRDELVLIAPCDMIDENEKVDISILKELPIVLREEGSGTRNVLAQEFKNKKISFTDLNIIANVENTQTIKSMVASGIGCSIISSKAIENEIELKAFRKYRISDMELIRNFYFVYSKNKTLAPIERDFITFVVDYFKNDKFNANIT